MQVNIPSASTFLGPMFSIVIASAAFIYFVLRSFLASKTASIAVLPSYGMRRSYRKQAIMTLDIIFLTVLSCGYWGHPVYIQERRCMKLDNFSVPTSFNHFMLVDEETRGCTART